MRAISIPLVTGAPSSTVRSISLPGTLKEISTCVNSIFPDTKIRLALARASLAVHNMRAATATTTTTSVKSRIRRFIFSSRDHAANGPRRRAQIDAGDAVVVKRVDAVIARALQAGLRVGHFDAGGYSRLVAPLCLRKLILGQLQPFFSGCHFRVRGRQALEREPHIQFDLVAQIRAANSFLAIFRGAFGAPRIATPAVEERNFERHSRRASRNRIVDGGAARSIVAESRE